MRPFTRRRPRFVAVADSFLRVQVLVLSYSKRVYYQQRRDGLLRALAMPLSVCLIVLRFARVIGVRDGRASINAIRTHAGGDRVCMRTRTVRMLNDGKSSSMRAPAEVNIAFNKIVVSCSTLRDNNRCAVYLPPHHRSKSV